jgi:hypothetical protein
VALSIVICLALATFAGLARAKKAPKKSAAVPKLEEPLRDRTGALQIEALCYELQFVGPEPAVAKMQRLPTPDDSSCNSSSSTGGSYSGLACTITAVAEISPAPRLPA